MLRLLVTASRVCREKAKKKGSGEAELRGNQREKTLEDGTCQFGFGVFAVRRELGHLGGPSGA